MGLEGTSKVLATDSRDLFQVENNKRKQAPKTPLTVSSSRDTPGTKAAHAAKEPNLQEKAIAIFKAVDGDIVTEIFGENDLMNPNISRMFQAKDGKNLNDPQVISIVTKLYDDWVGPNAQHGL